MLTYSPLMMPQIWKLASLICLVVLSGVSSTAEAQSDEDYEMMEEDMEGAPAAKAPIPLTETGPSPAVLWQMAKPDFSRIGTELARLVEPSDIPAAPIATGPKLRNEAHVAFRYGNLPMARELFFGHLALGEESAASELSSVQFSSHFRRPAWHIRWGLAIGATGSTDAASFDPIRAGGGSRNGGGFDGGDFDGMDDMGMDESDMGFDEMEFDEMEDDMDMDMGMDDMGMDGMGDGRRRRAPAAPVMPDASITDESIATRLDELTGLVGTTLAEGMTTRVTSGGFGAALTAVAPEDLTQGYTVGGDSVSPADMKMWIPGVIFVGEGSSREMLERAHKEGIELLLYIVVSLKESRTGEVQNISRAKVIDCKSGKTLVASGGMDNREVKRLAATGRGSAEGHVNEQLETFWQIIDSRLKLSAFPTLTPEIARRRVTQLMADASYSKLRKLAEVRLLHEKGWLTDEDLELAYEIIAGPEGTKILYGPKAESIPIIRDLVRYSLVRTEE